MVIALFTLIIASMFLKLRWASMLMAVFTSISLLCYSISPGLSLMMDDMSTWLITLSIYLWGLMILPPCPTSNPSQSSTLSVLTVVLVVLFCTNSLLLFYILFEASLIPMLLIILGWGPQPERVAATIYMIFYTVAGSLPFLAILLLFNHISFSNPNQIIMGASLSLLVTLPFLIKTPVFLLHLWLPKAHVEAPVYGSMVLAGVLLKIGSFGIWRVTPIMAPQSNLMSLVVVGGVISTLITTIQTDIKLLIAYSSVVHMSLTTNIILLSTKCGVTPVLFMLLAHGVCSSGLFYMATCIYQMYSSRSLVVIQGVLAILPAFVIVWVISIMMNMSTPPSLSLASEILMSAVVMSLTTFYSILVGALVLMSLVYSIQLFSLTTQGAYHEPSSQSLPLAYYMGGYLHSKWWLLGILLMIVMM